MILNQTDFFARSATLDGAISDTDTQITLSGLSTRFTDAVAAGTAGYENGTGLGPFRVDDNDGFELIAITAHVSGNTFEVKRGIQGTDALAWADGTAVRAVVTREQLSTIATSQYPHKRYIFVDTFDGPDGTIDGRTAPTGQVWAVKTDLPEYEGGNMSLQNGLLRVQGTALIMEPLPMQCRVEIVMQQATTFASVYGFLLYQDDDNFVVFQREGASLRIKKVVNGSRSTLVQASISGSARNTLEPYTIVFNNGLSEDEGADFLYRGHEASTSDTDVLSIMENNTAYGITSETFPDHRVESIRINDGSL